MKQEQTSIPGPYKAPGVASQFKVMKIGGQWEVFLTWTIGDNSMTASWKFDLDKPDNFNLFHKGESW